MGARFQIGTRFQVRHRFRSRFWNDHDNLLARRSKKQEFYMHTNEPSIIFDFVAIKFHTGIVVKALCIYRAKGLPVG